jgi:DNA-binding transcriptional ArsR family regulator
VPKYSSLDRIFQALADPTRRTLVERLAQGDATVTELSAPFAMALPSLMQHLAVLEAAGLVRSSKSGRVRTYSLQPQALKDAESWLHAQQNVWVRRFDQFDQFVMHLAEEEKLHTASPNPDSPTDSPTDSSPDTIKPGEHHDHDF